MIQLIESLRGDIESLCRKYRVSKMEVFGSAVTGEFDEQASDIDFLVSFHELEIGEYVDTYFGLLEELQELLHRRIDLVMESAIDNPYFLREIEKTRTLLYAA